MADYYSSGKEEQFILRVPPKLAERIRAVLREHGAPEDHDIDLHISEDKGDVGKFIIGGEKFPCSVLNLPCVVEAFKTYDDVNLVKSADVGQVITVTEKGKAPASTPREFGNEAIDGVTPPMQNARKRHFRKDHDIDGEDIEAVEADLVRILNGKSARNVEIETVEEEYVIMPNGKGEWRQIKNWTDAAAQAAVEAGNMADDLLADMDEDEEET